MKEHTGFILKVVIAIAFVVIGVLILMGIILPPFGWKEIPVGLVSLFAAPIYFFIDLLIKKKKVHSTGRVNIVQNGNKPISVAGDVINSHIGDIINNDPKPLIEKITELTEAKSLAEYEMTLWKENYKKLEEEYKNKEKLSDYRQRALELRAKNKIEEAIKSVDTEAGDEEAANRHIFKAELLIDNFQFDEAEQHYKQAVTIFPSYNSNFAMAVFYNKLNKFPEAIEYLSYCLNFVTTQIRRAAVLNNIGDMHLKNKDYNKAETFLIESSSIYMELNTNEYFPDFAVNLNNLGILYRNKKEYSNSALFYNKALKVWREAAEKNPDKYLCDVAMTLNNLGNLYREKKEYSDAEVFYEEALEIRRKLADKNPDIYLPDFAISLNNLGVLHLNKNEYTKAETFCTEALKIQRKLADKNPAYIPDVADTLSNLGILYRNKKEYTKAEASHNEALRIQRELADKNPDAYLPVVAKSLNNFGNFYTYKKEYTKAEVSYKEALKIRRELANKYPNIYFPDVANLLVNISTFYLNYVPNRELSLQYASEAIDILVKCNDTPLVRELLMKAMVIAEVWNNK
jgi:tetratricopeptide (TPR) repeat protein